MWAKRKQEFCNAPCPDRPANSAPDRHPLSPGAGRRPLPRQGGFLPWRRPRYFFKPRNILPSRKALSVQSPFGAGGEVDRLICLICLTPRPNRNRMPVHVPSDAAVASCPSRFCRRNLSAWALARSFSVAAGSKRTAAMARSFRCIAAADRALSRIGTGQSHNRIELARWPQSNASVAALPKRQIARSAVDRRVPVAANRAILLAMPGPEHPRPERSDSRRSQARPARFAGAGNIKGSRNFMISLEPSASTTSMLTNPANPSST